MGGNETTLTWRVFQVFQVEFPLFGREDDMLLFVCKLKLNEDFGGFCVEAINDWKEDEKKISVKFSCKKMS